MMLLMPQKAWPSECYTYNINSSQELQLSDNAFEATEQLISPLLLHSNATNEPGDFAQPML